MATDIGKYRVIRRLAVGGMGEILLARQAEIAGMDRLVVLKMLLPQLAEQVELVSEFLDEARIASRLNHPNIVSVYEVAQWQDTFFISMEYIHGVDLRTLIRRIDGPVPLQIAARITSDVASALDYAHHAITTEGDPLDVVHRDITPHNIVLRTDGVTKVVDFGIAKATVRAQQTQTGITKGKIHYMSPEQASGARCDGRSDIFSLGVVFWEMLTGQRLFASDNDIEAIAQLLNEPIPAPTDVNSDILPEVCDVVMRMLQRDVNQRYHRAGAVEEELHRCCDGLGSVETTKMIADFVDRTCSEEIAKRLEQTRPSSSGRDEPIYLQTFGTNEDESTTRHEGTSKRPNAQPDPAPGGIHPHVPLGSGDTVATQPRSPASRVLARLGVGLGLFAALVVALAFIWKAFVPLPATVSVVDQPPPPISAGPQPVVVRSPEGARVVVDGKPHDQQVPTTIRGMEVGSHTLRLELDSVQAIEETIMVHERATPLIVEYQVPRPQAVVDIRGPRGAVVEIDGEPWTSTAPCNVVGIAPGRHLVRLSLNGHAPAEIAVDLRPETPVLLNPQLPEFATLVVRSDPKAAELLLADEPRGNTPVTIAELLPSMPHALTLTRPGFTRQHLEVELAPGEKREIFISLIPQPAAVQKRRRAPPSNPSSAQPATARNDAQMSAGTAPPGPPGFLSVRTTPFSQVLVDGRSIGSTPLYRAKVPSGHRTITLINTAEGLAATRVINVRPGETSKLRIDLTKE